MRIISWTFCSIFSTYHWYLCGPPGDHLICHNLYSYNISIAEIFYSQARTQSRPHIHFHFQRPLYTFQIHFPLPLLTLLKSHSAKLGVLSRLLALTQTLLANSANDLFSVHSLYHFSFILHCILLVFFLFTLSRTFLGFAQKPKPT